MIRCVQTFAGSVYIQTSELLTSKTGANMKDFCALTCLVIKEGRYCDIIWLFFLEACKRGGRLVWKLMTENYQVTVTAYLFSFLATQLNSDYVHPLEEFCAVSAKFEFVLCFI